MRILTRYILREVLQHAGIGLLVFTFILFMRDVGRILELVVRDSAPFPSVAEIFFFTVPTALTYTLPMAVLVGILIGLSRLAADSEVTVMRSSGLGSGMFVRVILMFAGVAFLLACANSIIIAPRSAAALARLENSIKSSQIAFEIQPRVFYEDFKNYVLYVQDIKPGSGSATWKNVFVADITSPSSPVITLAQEAVVVGETPTDLHLYLRHGWRHETFLRNPKQYIISTFVEDQSHLPIVEPKDALNKLGEIVPVSELSTGELVRRSQQLDVNRARWYWIEFHRRIALPVACLVLALVGIPLGLASRQGGKSTGFVLTILLVFLYYFASLFGLALARQGKVPPGLGVWIANTLFAIVGIVLIWRVDRIPLQIASFGGFKKLRVWLRDGLQGSQARSKTVRGRFTSRFPQILDEYILQQFSRYFCMILTTFLILTLVFTFFELLHDIIRNRVPLVTVSMYLVNVVPSMIYLMTPLSVLIGVLVTFALLHKGNEITAMKSSGISIYRTVAPVLFVAAVVSVALFLFEHWYLPNANKRQETLRNNIKGRPAQTYLRPDRRWIVGQGSTIYYYGFFDADQKQFGSISAFTFDPKTFEITRRVYATKAQWDDELNKWVFSQGWVRRFSGEAIAEFNNFDVATFEDLKEPPAYFKKEVKQSSEMNYKELNRYIEDLQQSGYDVVRLRVQLHKKFAFPLITLIMAVLAIPFSLSVGRRGALAGIAVSIGIAITYWMVSGLFEAMGNVNQLPPALAAWSPDLIFALIGSYMVLKTPT